MTGVPHGGQVLDAARAASAWRAVQCGLIEDQSLHESLHHQVTLALEAIRRMRPDRRPGKAARHRWSACIEALGGDAALSALAAPWLARHVDGSMSVAHDLVPLSHDELDAIHRALGPAGEPSGWTGTDDADGLEPGIGWHLRHATTPELVTAIDASLARAARAAFDRHRAAGRIAPCWSLAAELHAFGGPVSVALSGDLVRWLDAVRGMEPGVLARVLLDEWRAASGQADDAAAWSWAGGGPGGVELLAQALHAHAAEDRQDATHAGLMALIANPLANDAIVEEALSRHGDLIDARIEAACAARARTHGRWRHGRLAWGAAKVALGLVVVGLGVSWVVRERQLDARAQALAAEVDAAVASGFDRSQFGPALTLMDQAAGEGLAARAAMLDAGARLRERMDARRAMEEQARAALAAAGSPDAPDAPIARVQSMLDGPMSDAQRSQVEAWLERARRAAADRDEALRAALAERVAAAQRAIDQAEEAARNGGDARALLVTARATVQSIAEDAALPASRKESAAALAPRLEELAARLDAEDASAAARAERVRAVEAIAAQVGDPAAYGAALQAFAEARPDDPLTPSIRTAMTLVPAWRTAVAWQALASELAADPLPESLVASRSQRERIESWLRDHASGPGVDAARRYLALLPREHDWSAGVQARVRDLKLDALALIVLRDGTRQWHRRPMTAVVERGGRITVQAIDSVNQAKPNERAIDVLEIVSDSAKPLGTLLAPMSKRLEAGADHGPDAALALMHELVSAQPPASEPAIDPVLRLYLARLVGLRAQQSLPALSSFLKPTLEAIDRENVDQVDWMAPTPRPDSAPAWIRAQALVASIAKLDLPSQWRGARTRSAALLSAAPRPFAMLCWEFPGGVITPSPDPARAGWSVVVPRGADGPMDPVGTVNQAGRVELVRPDRMKDRPSGSLLFVVPPAT
jgi:hypothetical protein